MPLVFVRVTVTATIEPGFPLATVNGTVSVNKLPEAFEAELEYHALNAEPSCTVMSSCATVLFVAGAKWKSPLTTSRVVEKPVTTTLNPPVPCTRLTVWMNGTFAVVMIVWDGAGLGVTSFPAELNVAVNVIVPATVPVRTAMLGEPLKEAAVEPAAIVKFAVRVPFEKRIIWSSPPTDEANVSVNVPVKSAGAALASAMVTAGCCAGPEVAGPPIVTAGSEGVASGNVTILLADRCRSPGSNAGGENNT